MSVNAIGTGCNPGASSWRTEMTAGSTSRSSVLRAGSCKRLARPRGSTTVMNSGGRGVAASGATGASLAAASTNQKKACPCSVMT